MHPILTSNIVNISSSSYLRNTQKFLVKQQQNIMIK